MQNTDAGGIYTRPTGVNSESISADIKNREKNLAPLYTQIAHEFADLHDRCVYCCVLSYFCAILFLYYLRTTVFYIKVYYECTVYDSLYQLSSLSHLLPLHYPILS